MTVTLLLVLALQMISYGVFTLGMLKRLPLAMAASVVGAALGKIIGITMARRRARRAVMRILADFT